LIQPLRMKGEYSCGLDVPWYLAQRIHLRLRLRRSPIRTAARICGLASLAALALLIFLVYDLVHDRTLGEASARVQARREVSLAAAKIDADLRRLLPIVNALTEDLSARPMPDGELLPRLRLLLERNPRLFGLGVAYVPYAHDPAVRLHAPYLMRTPAGIELRPLDKAYDYSKDLTKTWYHDAVAKGPTWTDYWGAATQSMVVVYSVPFFRADAQGQRSVAGVAYLTYTFGWIQSWVDEMEIGRTGYGFVLCRQGHFIVHPRREWVETQTRISEVAEARNDPALRKIGERATRGERGGVDYTDDLTGQSSWIFYEPIPTPAWSLGVVIIRDEVFQGNGGLRRRMIWILLAATAFLLLASLAVAPRLYTWKPGFVLWTGSVACSLLFLTGIASIWFLVQRQGIEPNAESTRVVDKTGLNRFLQTVASSPQARHGQLLYVPTGVFIQSLEFSTAYNVAVTGYIWQKYSPGHEGIARGFILPEAVDAEVTEAYRRRNGTVETVGWQFKATLRQSFNLARFPFDHENVWIRLWHKDFDRGVVLVPDLDAYSLTNPKARPGLEQQAVLAGWRVAGTYFDYRPSRYNSDFGISGYQGLRAAPELYFNVALRRSFLDSFVGHIIPLVAVAFMLFATLMTATRDSETASLSGFNTFSVLTATTALFFVVLLGHIQLRDAVRAMELMYLEYFYFAMYLAILLVSVHALLFTLNKQALWIVCYRDSLIVKLLYWPLLLGLMLAVTAVVFY
jgi:hypothetical protein